MGPYNNQPYDFANPAVTPALKNAFPDWNRVMALNDAHKGQFGTNITDAALFRNYNESLGNYLWGAPAGGAPADAKVVADPTARIATDTGTYQNGAFMPKPGLEGVYPARSNEVVNAPVLDSYAPQGSAIRQAITGTTNAVNQAPAMQGQGSAPAAGGAATGSQAAMKQLQDYMAGQQKPLDILTGRQQALGVPQAQQQVSGLRQAITNTTNILNQIAPSVQGRTMNSLVTSAQANRQIQNESAPVQAQLAGLGQQYGQAQGDYQNLLAQAQGEAGIAIEGQQTDLDNLQRMYQNTVGQEQAQEDQRRFNVQQATEREQFEKNLALETKRLKLSEDAQNEARRQFDAQQALSQQQFEHEQFWAGENNKLALGQLKQSQDEFAANNSLAKQQLALESQKARSGGGGSNLAEVKYAQEQASKQTQQNIVSQISNGLRTVTGKDGYVSPNSFKRAADDWVQAGYSLKDFNSYFGSFKNPNNPNYFK